MARAAPVRPTASRPTAARELTVWFEPDLLPGYAWSFPIGGGAANVGFGIQRGGSYQVGDMGALWRELRARPHIRGLLGPDAVDEGPPRAWPIPARVDEAVLASGPVLFVGDAAMATDPMTGEGIGQALLTGRWAAESIVTHDATATVRARPSRPVRAHTRIGSPRSWPSITDWRNGWWPCSATAAVRRSPCA